MLMASSGLLFLGKEQIGCGLLKSRFANLYLQFKLTSDLDFGQRKLFTLGLTNF
jgi:hypothetical protein